MSGRAKHQEIAKQKEDDKKVEFFLAASHQLKSPIAIIQWCLQSVMELSQNLDSQNRSYVSKALVQADAMSDLITDMLNVFRLMRGQDGPQTYSQVNLNTVLNQIMQQYNLVAEQKEVRLIGGDIEILPAILANEPYVRQVFINLIDNAIKYTPKGKVVMVSAQVVKVQKTEMIEVKVKDQGIGMTDADRAHLFTEFFRSPAAREIAHEGTGLGLVVVKHVVEDMGGTITVETKENQGTTFTVHLPIS